MYASVRAVCAAAAAGGRAAWVAASAGVSEKDNTQTQTRAIRDIADSPAAWRRRTSRHDDLRTRAAQPAHRGRTRRIRTLAAQRALQRCGRPRGVFRTRGSDVRADRAPGLIRRACNDGQASRIMWAHAPHHAQRTPAAGCGGVSMRVRGHCCAVMSIREKPDSPAIAQPAGSRSARSRERCAGRSTHRIRMHVLRPAPRR